MSSPLRPLIVAEAANPEWASVPLLGWSFYRAMARKLPCHLVTQIRNKPALDRAGLVEGRDYSAIDSEYVAAALWKISSKLRINDQGSWSISAAAAGLAYPTFEKLVWKAFRQDIADGRFNIVHRITPVSQSAVGSLATKLSQVKVPFVIGPLNGGVPWPKGFDEERAREGERLANLRKIVRHLPGRRRMLNDSAAVLVASRSAEHDIPASISAKTVRIPENAVDAARFNRIAVQDGSLPLRACFIGRFVPCKGLELLLNAASSLLRDKKMLLDLIGDGPETPRLMDQAARLGIIDSITFHGWLPHTRIQDVAVRSHVLTFPSIRDFGGGVVLEAMALGIVPIVVDYAGPAELVDQTTGFKVPLGNRDEIVLRLRATLEALCDDPGQLPALAAAGRDRVRDLFTWEAKAAQVCEVYDWVIGRRPDKPVFDFPG